MLESGLIEPKMLYRLTGSNQLLMDKNVKESLVGRASYYYLNTLSVNELRKAFPNLLIKEIMYKGGWPELYVNKNIETKSAALEVTNDNYRHNVFKCPFLN